MKDAELSPSAMMARCGYAATPFFTKADSAGIRFHPFRRTRNPKMLRRTMHHGLETITIREVALTYPHRVERLKKASGQDDAAAIVREIVAGRPQEHFIVLHLDAQNQVVSYSVAGIGTVDACLVHPREIFSTALRANASSIIIAHNHPSGDPTPSAEDRAVTKRLTEVGDILGCRVLDSLVVTADSYRSIMH